MVYISNKYLLLEGGLPPYLLNACFSSAQINHLAHQWQRDISHLFQTQILAPTEIWASQAAWRCHSFSPTPGCCPPAQLVPATCGEEANQAHGHSQWQRPRCSMCEASSTDSRHWSQRSKACANTHDMAFLYRRDLSGCVICFLLKKNTVKHSYLNAPKEVLNITNYLKQLNVSSFDNFHWKNNAIAFLTFKEPFCSVTTADATSFRAHHLLLFFT